MNSIPIDGIILPDPSMISVDVPDRLELQRFLGRSSLQRLLYQFSQSGARHCLVIVDAGEEEATKKAIAAQASELELKQMHLSVSADNLRISGHPGCAGKVLITQGNLVLDPRFFEKIREYGSPSVFVSNKRETVAFAKLDRRQIEQVMTTDGEVSERLESLSGVTHISEESIPRYVSSMRRSFEPYRLQLEETGDLKLAAAKVMDAAQKGVLDFPARYLHPIPENALAKMSAGTSITPNQITIASAILAFIGTYFFAMQSYLPALILAIVAGILDGVDGKLARIKLLSSPYGDRLDHTLDVSFEFSWYAALGWGLSQSTGNPVLLDYGLLMIGIMVLARALSGTYLYLTGRQIHDHTAFDRAVRLFAGRRNIYVLMLFAGYMMNSLLFSFYVVIVWGFVTIAIYAMRNTMALYQRLSLT